MKYLADAQWKGVEYGLQEWIYAKSRQPQVRITREEVERMYQDIKNHPEIIGFKFGLKKLKKVI